MNTTTHLAKHIQQFQPSKDAARLSLYHFLIHHFPEETPLSPGLIEQFIRYALYFKFWQQNRVALNQEVQYILQHYNETYQLNWNFKDIAMSESWQVINVHSRLESLLIIEKWIENNFEDDLKQSRILYTREKNFLVIVQFKNNELETILLSSTMVLKKGELQPLNTRFRLRYNPQLELKSNFLHVLGLSDSAAALFQVEGQAVKGKVLRGYMMQEEQKITGFINEFPKLYYPLKKIEQYFIDHKTDPSYQELIQSLEKSVELLRMGHPEAYNFARAAYERGKDANEHLYPQDNFITSLMKDLVDTMNNHKSRADLWL